MNESEREALMSPMRIPPQTDASLNKALSELRDKVSRESILAELRSTQEWATTWTMNTNRSYPPSNPNFVPAVKHHTWSGTSTDRTWVDEPHLLPIRTKVVPVEEDELDALRTIAEAAIALRDLRFPYKSSLLNPLAQAVAKYENLVGGAGAVGRAIAGLVEIVESIEGDPVVSD